MSSKRVFDFLVAASALLFLSPVVLLIAIFVRIRLGHPILFRQLRPGRHGKPFVMYKFRTMTEGRDAEGNPLPNEDRRTPFGDWLRSTSLDELPELLNVVKGDMSLVGPRPLLLEYLPFYTPEQARRHDVPPGITGWAQIHGRNALNWEEKLQLDVWYVDNWSFWMDIRILLVTILKVVRREGITAADGGFIRPFTQAKLEGHDDGSS